MNPGYGPAPGAFTQIQSGESLLERNTCLRETMQGLAPNLAQILRIEGLSDLLINGTDAVWIDRGRGLEPCPQLGFSSPQQLRDLAVRMAGAGGQRLDDASPIVDALLGSDLRLHAILPPLSGDQPVISLRKISGEKWSLEKLQKAKMFTPALEKLLKTLVQRRFTGLICGATGSGKTTLLASLLSLVPANQRLICIEEVSELRPAHPHVVNLQSRRPNIQGAGEITLSQLVKAAMRMRPDRLILGEARGAEVREMLGAMNTGHQGGWATIHANSALDVPARLEALGSYAHMDRAMVGAAAGAGIDIVLHLDKHENRRYLKQVAVLEYDRELRAKLALEISPEGESKTGPAWPALSRKLDANLGGDHV